MTVLFNTTTLKTYQVIQIQNYWFTTTNVYSADLIKDIPKRYSSQIHYDQNKNKKNPIPL